MQQSNITAKICERMQIIFGNVNFLYLFLKDLRNYLTLRYEMHKKQAQMVRRLSKTFKSYQRTAGYATGIRHADSKC